MSNFSYKMHGSMVNGKTKRLMKNPPWQISWQVASSRHVCRLICLVAWCAARCALLPGAPPDARLAGKSLALHINLIHCYQTKIEPIIQSCITLFKINVHSLYIWILILFLIYLIVFLITTPLIHLINIIIIIFFLNVLDFVYYMLH